MSDEAPTEPAVEKKPVAKSSASLPVEPDAPQPKPSPKPKKLPGPPRLRIVNVWNQMLNFNHGAEFISLLPRQEVIMLAPPSPAVARLAAQGRLRVFDVE